FYPPVQIIVNALNTPVPLREADRLIQRVVGGFPFSRGRLNLRLVAARSWTATMKIKYPADIN
ncbi:hypothetical protein, partial [Akkermansia muciniphila]